MGKGEGIFLKAPVKTRRGFLDRKRAAAGKYKTRICHRLHVLEEVDDYF
jgi:hypothetical protein